MKNTLWILGICISTLFSNTLIFGQAAPLSKMIPAPLQVGVSLESHLVTLKTMEEAKAAGISCIQLGVNDWFDTSGNFKYNDHEIEEKVEQIRAVSLKTGVKIWNIHMPFGKYIDISLCDEKCRRKVVALHKKVLFFCKSLQPKVILFHPSWYLSLNQRELHKNQLIKSALELYPVVRDLGDTMVIENMTGPALYVVSHGIKYERPLLRTVEETVAIMKRLPNDIYGAVDMNHILHPEKLILALGSRLKLIHVADGDGANERHYYPYDGKGMNDWMAIMAALDKASYKGPFLFESHYKDLIDLSLCYQYFYSKYILDNYIRQKYQ